MRQVDEDDLASVLTLDVDARYAYAINAIPRGGALRRIEGEARPGGSTLDS